MGSEQSIEVGELLIDMAKFLHRAAYIFRSIVGHSDVKWPTFASNTNYSITDMYIAAYPLDTQFEFAVKEYV